MKKLYLIPLFLLSVLVSQASPVSRERAHRFVDENILQIMPIGTSVDAIEPVVYNSDCVYYVINMKPEGWAIVSASDAVQPLIAYSTTGKYDITPDMSNANWWMERYKREISQAIKDGDAPLAEWTYKVKPVTRGKSDVVDPIIQVHWNQGKPYNQFCPSDAEGTAVVGCVAVGMAQAMSVAKWPARPNGQYQYRSNRYGILAIDYDLEEPYDWKVLTDKDAENHKLAAAHLLYHCGISVNMDYGPDGSGAISSAIVTALKRNFSYPDCVRHLDREGYSESEWNDIMVNELKEGRAIVYHGHDTKGNYGHCFNIDGYDGNSHFHVNWGWGGSGDAYFALYALRDSHMNMNYDANLGAIIGVRAPSSKPTDFTLSSTEVQANVPSGTFVASIRVSSEVENSYRYKITGPYNIVKKKYESVPFKFDLLGNLVTTETLKAGEQYEVIITVTPISSPGDALVKNFVLTVVNETSVNQIVDESSILVSEEYYSLDGRKREYSDIQSGIYLSVKMFADGKKSVTKCFK